MDQKSLSELVPERGTPTPLLIIEDQGLGAAEAAHNLAAEWSGQPVQDFSGYKLSVGTSSGDLSVSEATRSLGFKSSLRRALILDLNGSGLEVQNALLKILEEPPEQVWIILLAGSDFPVLATIRSRCEVYRSSAWDSDQLGAWGREQGFDLTEPMVGAAAGSPYRLAWINDNREALDDALRGDLNSAVRSMLDQDDQKAWVTNFLSVFERLSTDKDLSEARNMCSAGVRPELVLAYAFLL